MRVRQRLLSTPFELQPQLGAVATQTVGAIVRHLDQAREARCQRKAQRRIPLAAVTATAIGMVVVVRHHPAQLAGEAGTTEVAADARIAILQTTDRSDVEL